MDHSGIVVVESPADRADRCRRFSRRSTKRAVNNARATPPLVIPPTTWETVPIPARSARNANTSNGLPMLSAVRAIRCGRDSDHVKSLSSCTQSVWPEQGAQTRAEARSPKQRAEGYTLSQAHESRRRQSTSRRCRIGRDPGQRTDRAGAPASPARASAGPPSTRGAWSSSDAQAALVRIESAATRAGAVAWPMAALSRYRRVPPGPH